MASRSTPVAVVQNGRHGVADRPQCRRFSTAESHLQIMNPVEKSKVDSDRIPI
jgi:hypothetical protein